MNSLERMQAVFAGRPPDRLPVQPIVMMFAARFCGRRYAEYLRDFRVLAECQVRTAEALGLDMVTLCSDPARECEDCGGQAQWHADAPPAIKESESLLLDKSRLARLKVPDPLAGGRMWDRVQGAARLRERVGNAVPVCGWIEGPLAEAADLRGINRVMVDLMDDPAWVRELFEFVLEMETRFARAQVQAGVHIMGIGDAAASLIGPELYREHVWPYEKRLIDAVHAMGCPVRLHICGRIDHLLADIAGLGVEMIDIDYPTNLAVCREKLGPAVTIHGNFDPVGVLQNGSPRTVREACARCREAVPGRFIPGPGCEVPPDSPPANVRAMVEYAQEMAAGT